MNEGYYGEEKEARENTKRHIEKLEEDIKLIAKFEEFINKIDTACGGLLGKGNGFVYEKVTVTEYKKENKVVEDAIGNLKEGQCFILKSNFNYGRSKGYTYRIHEEIYEDGQKRYYVYKLNGKKTRECTGKVNQANYWWLYDTKKFLKWIEQNHISWCHIEKVKTPYEVEKVVKKAVKTEGKTVKAEGKKEQKASEKKQASKPNKEQEEIKTQDFDVNKFTYKVSEDIDTRTNEGIYLVKILETLSSDEYIQVNRFMRSIGGYYSKFKHAFLFKEDPTEKLNTNKLDQESFEKEKQEKETEKTIEMIDKTKETADSEEKKKKESVNYIIIEDTNTNTGQKIWLVKLGESLNKSDFAEVKRKLATIQGFYSSFKQGFIFKYDPREKLKSA